MNHAEQAAFWYLRLNGFFPLANFVIHRGAEIIHSPDCDVLAVRPAHVYEPVGGQYDDWDPYLRECLDLRRQIGVACQVKSGRYTVEELFSDVDELAYCIQRLGFAPAHLGHELAYKWMATPTIELDDGTQLVKLLVARETQRWAVPSADPLGCSPILPLPRSEIPEGEIRRPNVLWSRPVSDCN